jgi:hypothetical protein
VIYFTVINAVYCTRVFVARSAVARRWEMPACKSCGYQAKDWHDLALHIAASKRGHYQGKKWAASVLTHAQSLNQKRDKPEPSPMADEERAAVTENKRDIHHELSGDECSVKTYCPSCKNVSFLSLPVEYVNGKDAWRLPNNTLVVCCFNCRQRH